MTSVVGIEVDGDSKEISSCNFERRNSWILFDGSAEDAGHLIFFRKNIFTFRELKNIGPDQFDLFLISYSYYCKGLVAGEEGEKKPFFSEGLFKRMAQPAGV